MSLGRREARHQSVAAAKVAGVEPSADWDFHPGQRVQTVDGLPGRVTAVQDGPVRGAEGYEVTLDDGMGGGLYTSSQLAPAPATEASLQETAAADYPELEEILHSRPDIATNTVLGSLKTAINDAEMSQASSERRGWHEHDDDELGDEADDEIDDQDDYYSQHSGAEDNYGDPYGKMDAYHDMKNASLHETAGWSWADPPKGNPYKRDTGFVPPPPRDEDEGAKTAADETGLSDDGDDGFGSEVYCTDCHDYHGERRHKDSSPAKDYDGVDTSEGGNTLANGMSSSSDSGSNSVTSAVNPINLPPEVTPEKRDEWLAGGHTGFDEHGHSKYHDTRRWRNSPSECVKSGEHMSLEGGPGYANGEGTCARCGDKAEPTVVEPYQQLLMHKALEGGKDYQDSELLMRGNDPEPPKPEAPKAKPEPIIGYPKDLVDQIPKATPEQTKFLDSNPTGPTKYSAAGGHQYKGDYCLKCGMDKPGKGDWAPSCETVQDSFGDPKTSSLDIFDPFDLLVTASTDPDFRFEVTAAWSDVRRKAKRIRTTGGVNVTLVTEGMIFAEIKGDHNVYETGLQKLPGKMSVQGWSCGCKWGAYHWGADDDFSRFAGRMCSHALALQFEAQARGMFGRNVEPDMEKPSWVPRRVVVKYDIDADQNRSARPTYPDYGRVAVLSALSVLSAYAKAEGMGDDDFAVECVLAGVTASVNSPWGEPQANVPEVQGPTRPSHPTDNPASTGWASAPDPDSWGGLQTPDSISMGASLNCHRTKADYAASEADDTCKDCGYPVSDHEGQYSGGNYGESNTYQASLDEFLFEAGGGPTMSGGSMVPAAGPESTLHDEPEAALPSTEGEIDMMPHGWSPDPVGSGPALGNGSPSGGSSGGAGDLNWKGETTTHMDPENQSIMTMGGVEDIVASFQQKAAHLDPGAGGGQGDGDIAAAAKEFLAKEAVKDFTPGEQATIINEGQGVTAANLDRLDIAGTHYEPLEAALAARDAEEDDDAWMA